MGILLGEIIHERCPVSVGPTRGLKTKKFVVLLFFFPLYPVGLPAVV